MINNGLDENRLLALTKDKEVEGLPNNGSPFALPTQDEIDSKYKRKDGILSGFTTPIKRADYEDYMRDVRPEFGLENLDKMRANNQTGWEQGGSAIIRTLEGELLGGTIQSVGALLELPEMAKDIYNEATGKDYEVVNKNGTDFNNFMLELGTKLQDHAREVAPIYRQNPNKAMDFSDFGYWMENAPSVFSSLSMLIPAWGAEKLASAGLMRAAKLLGVAEKIPDMAKYGTKLFGTAAFMRHAENIREASSLYNTVNQEVQNHFQDDTEYDNFLNGEYMNTPDGADLRKLLTGDRVKDKTIISNYLASQASWKDYKINSTNIGFDMLQLMPLMKGFPIKTRSADWASKAAKMLGKEKLPSIVKGVGNFGIFAGEQLTEGVEEAINGIGEEEGLYQYGRALGVEAYKNSNERLKDYIKDDSIKDQALWGWLGGITFGGITETLGKYNPMIKQRLDQSELKQRFGNVRKKAITNAVANIAVIRKQVADKKLTLEEAKQAFNEQKSNLAVTLGYAASQAGEVDTLLDYINQGDLKKKILESYSVDDLKEIGIDDIDKSVEHLTKEVLETERLFKIAHNSLFTKDINSGVKQQVGFKYVANAFNAIKIKEHSDKLEVDYNELAAKDDYLLNRKEDMAENTIHLRALEKVLEDLNKQKIASQILHGTGSEQSKKIQEKIDNFSKVVEKQRNLIGGEEASLKGLNKELINIRAKQLWNKLLSDNFSSKAAEHLTDKSVKAAAKKAEEVAKEETKKVTTAYEESLKTTPKAELEKLEKVEKDKTKKGLIKARLKEIEAEESLTEAEKLKKAAELEKAKKDKEEAEAKKKKEEAELKDSKLTEKANELLTDFDPTTVDLSNPNPPDSASFEDIITYGAVDNLLNGSETVENILSIIENQKDNPRVVEIAKFALAKKIGWKPSVKSEVVDDIEAKKADIERRREEELNTPIQNFKNAKTKEDLIKAAQDWLNINPYDSADSPMNIRSTLLTIGGFEKGKELFIDFFKKANEIRAKQINTKYDAELTALDKSKTQEAKEQLFNSLNELSKEVKKANKTGRLYSSIVPTPLITTGVIKAIQKVVKASIKLGYYKFLEILNQIKNLVGNNFSKSYFNAVKSAYLNELQERRLLGLSNEGFDSAEVIEQLQYDATDVMTDEQRFATVPAANVYLASVNDEEGKRKYEASPTGLRAKDKFVTNALKELKQLKPGDKVVIMRDTNDRFKDKTSMEEIPLKIVSNKYNNIPGGVHLGYLNDLNKLKAQIEFGESLLTKTLEELEEIEVNSKKLPNSHQILLNYRLREITGNTKITEKPYEVFLNQVLKNNYSNTLALRQAFMEAKEKNQNLEVEVAIKTGGEFVKLAEPLSPDKIFKDDEYFSIPIRPLNEEDPFSINEQNQTLVSNKDKDKTFVKVNAHLDYRNIDKVYTQGFIYKLVPTFMSDPNDHRTWTPSPMLTQKVSEDMIVPIKKILADILKMQMDGTTFENEDFQALIKRLGNYIVVKEHRSKNKLGTVINASQTNPEINNITFEFFNPNDGLRYRAVLYAKAKAKLTDGFGNVTGYAPYASMYVQQYKAGKDGELEYDNLDDDNKEFTGIIENNPKDLQSQTNFREQLSKILLSLPRSVKWSSLESNEAVEGYDSYTAFLNETGAWKTDVGLLKGDNNEEIGYVTPFGDNKLVFSLKAESAKPVNRIFVKPVSDEELNERMNKCSP